MENKILIFSLFLMSRAGLLRDKLKNIPTLENRPEIQTYETGHHYNLKHTLPGDSDVAGFAKGVDDLGQILLNAKKEIKFNRNLVTPAGANYWLSKKNAKLPPGKPKWSYANVDINGDGTPEVVIMDGKGDIRYINGYHLSKSKHNFNYAYQEFIDEQGTPYQRQLKRALGQVKPKEWSQTRFKYENTQVDPNNPDGALIPIGKLAEHGYKTKAPSACNLLLSYFTKFHYKEIVISLFPNSERHQKAMNQIYGVVRANADLYSEYVTEYVNEYFSSKGIPGKDAKKRYGNQPSEYSKMALQRVHDICNNKDGLGEQARTTLTKTVTDIKNQFLTNVNFPAEVTDYPLKNPRVIEKGKLPNIRQYIDNYRSRVTPQATQPAQTKLTMNGRELTPQEQAILRQYQMQKQIDNSQQNLFKTNISGGGTPAPTRPGSPSNTDGMSLNV